MQRRVKAVLFDVDGTLVDSNDAHAAAWVKAFAEHGITVDPIRVRRCIGMGGDKLMPEVSGIQEDSPLGEQISTRRAEIFKDQFLPGLEPFTGAKELVSEIISRGYTAVAASSASKEDLKALLKIVGADQLFDDKTSSDDADNSKPDPDIVVAALTRAAALPTEAIMIGDTPYDVAAARSAGVRIIALRSGGWLDPDLVGAVEIYDGVWDVLARLDRSVLSDAG